MIYALGGGVLSIALLATATWSRQTQRSWCQPHRNQYLNSCQQQDQARKLLLILFYKECDATDLQKNQIWNKNIHTHLFICSFLDLRVKQKTPLHHNVKSGCYYLIMSMFLWKHWLPKILFYLHTLPLAERTTYIWKTITFFFPWWQIGRWARSSTKELYHHHLGCYSPLKWVEKKSVGGSFLTMPFSHPNPGRRLFPAQLPLGLHSPRNRCRGHCSFCFRFLLFFYWMGSGSMDKWAPHMHQLFHSLSRDYTFLAGYKCPKDALIVLTWTWGSAVA